MNVLRQQTSTVKQLYVYSVPDDIIFEKWGDEEKFMKLMIDEDPALMLWLEEVMPHKKRIGKTFADEKTSNIVENWDVIISDPPKDEKKWGAKDVI